MNSGMVKRWNGSTIFCLSTNRPAFIIFQIVFFLAMFSNQENMYNSNKNSSETFRHVFYRVLFWCMLAIAISEEVAVISIMER